MKNILNIIIVAAAFSLLSGCESTGVGKVSRSVTPDGEVVTVQPDDDVLPVFDLIQAGLDLWNIFK